MGGDQALFLRAKEARDLLLAVLSGRQEASRPGTDRSREEEQARADRVSWERRAWRERQHQPWNTGDARSRAWEGRGQDWRGAGQPSVTVDTFSVQAIQFGSMVLDGTGWRGRFVTQGQRVVASIYPPGPVRIDSDDVSCVIYFSADRSDLVALRGPILERSYDQHGRGVIMVSADLLPAESKGVG